MQWWRQRSIRWRLTLWYAGTLAVVLLLYGGCVFVFVWRSMSAQLDRQLHEDFEIAEAMLIRSEDGKVAWRVDDHHHEDESHESLQVEVWSPGGELLFRSDSVRSVADLLPSPGDGQRRIASVSRTDDRGLRYLEDTYSIAGRGAIVRVIRSEGRYRQTLERLALIEFLGLPIGIAVAGIGGYTLARRALAPVAQMTDKARSITADRLDERLDVANPNDELGRLAQVFNDAFARIQRSFEQLKRFTADASHELRTPLTSIRSVGEVALREQTEPRAYRDAIGSMLEEVDRLTHLIDSLLVLSRSDAGPMKLDPTTVNLGDLVREAVGDLSVLAEEKGQVVSIEADESATVSADRMILRHAVLNLLDNAIKYSPEGIAIEVAVQRGEGIATVSIRDSGPGIPSSDQARIFDRFYRLDKARSRELGGAGLGLSIARWAVEAHGGRIELQSEPGQGSTFTIILPEGQGDSA